MAGYERSYGTARAVFSFLEGVGWLICIGGLIVAVVGVSQMGQIRSYPEATAVYGLMFAGVLFSLVGLLSVAFVQSSRANVDQAEMSRDMLALMKQGEVGSSTRSIATSSNPDDQAVGSFVKVYKGYQITKHEQGVQVFGIVFASVLFAEEFIDGMEKRK